MDHPRIATGHLATDRALRAAWGDVAGNIVPVQVGLLDQPRPALMAGLTYEGWTRDAAINCWNLLSAVDPATARSTLEAEVVRDGTSWRLRGQYWDAVIWVLGAWDHALWTGDLAWLGFAREVSAAHLARMEREELSPELGLFRGAACFQDGVAGYPDRYARAHGKSCILDYAGERHPVGVGLPMHALSTNCIYALAYAAVQAMDRWLGRTPDAHLVAMGQATSAAITRHFRDGDRLRHLVDAWGGDDRSEALGHAFAALAGLAPDGALRRLPRQPGGIPALWPTFPRYAVTGRPGRHAGLVWPHVEGFIAEAAALGGDHALAEELIGLSTARYLRDGQATECYHPQSGLPDGGVQEITPGEPEDWHAWCLGERVGAFEGTPLHHWLSQPRTTWGATALWRMVLRARAGITPAPEGLRIVPRLPAGSAAMVIDGLIWRGARLTIRIQPGGSRIRIDGVEHAAVPATLTGSVFVEVG